MNVVAEEKKFIRESLKDLLPDGQIEHKIGKKIAAWKVYQQAQKVGFYMSLADEINLSFILTSGKECFLPRFEASTNSYKMALVKSEESLLSGKFAIPEPAPGARLAVKDEIDLWFVPGVAFDRKGNRLGRGRGFYDRLLAGEKGLKVGVCDFRRVVKEIGSEIHDIKMDFVLTDQELITITN